MAKKGKDKTINLLPQIGFAASAAGRILTWMLSSFRVIVIVTEIIVMIAFLSRFWLDARNTDLKEQILQKQAVIAASSDFESEFKFTQERLEIFSDLTAKKGIASSVVNAITSSLPPDVFLESLELSSAGIKIKGMSPSERSVQQFIANIASVETIELATLREINPKADDEFLIAFAIDVVLKE